MIVFGTFHRLANVNTSLNSTTLDAKKEKRNLFGKHSKTRRLSRTVLHLFLLES